jgi:hypothetical protein
MLDTYNFRTESVTHEVTKSVHEHRAPTDESLKLLREMQDKARAEIERAVRITDCDISAVIYRHYDIQVDQDKFKILYKVNGKMHEVMYDFDSWRHSKENILRELVIGIRDALAQDIANQIIGPAMDRLYKQGALHGLN